MTAEVQTYTKYTCKRCSNQVELPGGSLLGLRTPSGWKKINNILLCSSCVSAYSRGFQAWFNQFMREGKSEVKR